MQVKYEFQLILLRFSISLLKAPFTKLLWGIVPWYVTPPMVQLVFVLVLYSLQIFAAQVTLFLSLHVKFMRSQVILMHDISSRHFQEQLLPILFSFIHFYFEVTKNFRNFQKMIRRFLRGSSSQGSQDKQAKKRKRPSIIFLVQRKYGRVNGPVMNS